jgi:group II intron reverse transcriptase/maturase
MLAAKPRKRARLRHNEYYDLQGTFDELYANSAAGMMFTDLLTLISSEENIMLAYRNIKRNKGSNTCGIDPVTIKDIEILNAESYVERIRQMLSWYIPRPVRRKEIPKNNGKVRQLGIPSIWDRLLQQCILQALEPICEAKFFERSNGFRPNRSAEHAIAQCYHMIMLTEMNFVVDIDIKGFFDNVNHTKLVQQMWALGIRDKNLLCIIRKMLKAPIVYPDGHMEYPTKGTPQGGILSPLLSNIVLNELDWWVASNWENFQTRTQYKKQYAKSGAENKGNLYKVLRKSNLKEMYIVRYADDFKIFCKTRSAADRTFIAVKQWLNDRLKLQISEDKSKVTNLKKQYTDFLGFKIKARRKGKGYVPKSHVCDKASERIKNRLKDQVDRIRSPKNGRSEYQEVNRYNAIVLGEQNYYEIATCIASDFRRIGFEVNQVLKNSLKKRLKKKGEIENKAFIERYGKSEQVRYISKKPLLPIAYVRNRKALWKKRSVNAYTPEGRSEIHKDLGFDTHILHLLMRTKEGNYSIEYMDNRLSLYCAQYGKCSVTGSVLEYEDIHCHHKIPRNMGGKDVYSNLTIVHADIHRLIHAVRQETITRYLQSIKPDCKALKKLNQLRKKVGNEPITT